MEKFVALYDLHWGYERVGGHKVPVHDVRALKIALAFMKDFQPDTIILGGDMLDCRQVSHWTATSPGQTEGMKLFSDAKELRERLIQPCEKLADRCVYIEGNHEDWLNQFVDKHPALEGIVEINNLLRLDNWTLIPQGGAYQLGKLTFIHGDQISGGVNAAANATNAYEASVRLGHFHTYQAATKTSAVKLDGHTGVVVPCMCKNGIQYAKGAPARYMQGFLWGYVEPRGKHFNDYVTVITDGQAIIQGKVYRG